MRSRWRSSSPLLVIVASASDQNLPCCWRVPTTCRLIALNTFSPILLRLQLCIEGRLALVAKGLAAYRATGALVWVPKVLSLLADCYRNAGEPREGLKCLDEAACLIEATQIRSAEAGMYRRKGELLLIVGDRAAAETSLLQAINVARREKAKLLELQAASVLAQFWRDQGNRAEARDLLGPIYNWFTEGFDAPDLKDAKVLLDQLV